MKTKKLTLGMFKRIVPLGSFGHYFSYKDDKYEVCLESCLNGYDVAIYDLNQNLIGEKTCTNIDGILGMQILPGFSFGTGEALEKALKIANKKYNNLLKENEN
jgi:hypothetical protein